MGFRTFLKYIWFSILSVYCFLNISVLSVTVFSLQFCAKYFEVKLSKAGLDWKFFVSIYVYLMSASANSSLLQWKLDTKYSSVS